MEACLRNVSQVVEALRKVFDFDLPADKFQEKLTADLPATGQKEDLIGKLAERAKMANEYAQINARGVISIYELWEPQVLRGLRAMLQATRAVKQPQFYAAVVAFSGFSEKEIFEENKETGWKCGYCEEALDESQLAASMAYLGEPTCRACAVKQYG